jgi:hypothetical protein
VGGGDKLINFAEEGGRHEERDGTERTMGVEVILPE